MENIHSCQRKICVCWHGCWNVGRAGRWCLNWRIDTTVKSTSSTKPRPSDAWRGGDPSLRQNRLTCKHCLFASRNIIHACFKWILMKQNICIFFLGRLPFFLHSCLHPPLSLSRGILIKKSFLIILEKRLKNFKTPGLINFFTFSWYKGRLGTLCHFLSDFSEAKRRRIHWTTSPRHQPLTM